MFNFEINGDKLRLRVEDSFGDGTNCTLYLDTFDEEKWRPLAYPDFYLNSTDTKEVVYGNVKTALDEINSTLEDLYGKDTTVPLKGIELVRWIIENEVELSEKKVVLK